jgi:ParB family transcriptional regulator, chromosome partitioning protein
MNKTSKSKVPFQQIKVGRGTDALFCEPDTDSLQTIALDRIQLPPQQPRKYFDPTAMAGLVASVKAHGVLEPILVRPLAGGLYELIAGERRYRAATAAGSIDIPAITKDISATEAWQIALIENLLREDLNPIEETEGILELLALRLNLDRERVTALLYGLLNNKQRMTDRVISHPQGLAVIEIFEQIGSSWESFIANRLPLLKLPADILAAIGAGNLEYTKGRAIARLEDPQARAELLQLAIAEGYSLVQIRQWISQRLAQSVADRSTPSLQARFDRVLKQAKKSRVWSDTKKQKKLEKLISQLEDLVEVEPSDLRINN